MYDEINCNWYYKFDREVNIMNQEQFEGLWHQLKGKAKEQWGKLTDDDLAKIDGNLENLYGVIREKYGYTLEEAKREVNKFFSY